MTAEAVFKPRFVRWSEFSMAGEESEVAEAFASSSLVLLRSGIGGPVFCWKDLDSVGCCPGPTLPPGWTSCGGWPPPGVQSVGSAILCSPTSKSAKVMVMRFC